MSSKNQPQQKTTGAGRGIHKLSEKKVATLRKTKGRYADGAGLYLQVMNPPHNASWLFRYERDGKERWMGLGPLHTFDLKEARERARAIRQQLHDGKDPVEAKREARAAEALEAAQTITFAEAAERYFEAHEKKWTNAKSRAQFLSTLKAYAYPIIGALPVAKIDTGLVLRVIEPIWVEKTATADRVRGRIETVLGWAAIRGYRAGDNPARWKGHLSEALPASAEVRQGKHHPALPYAGIAPFMAELKKQEGVAARALEFTILTAARSGEALGARWDEIDLEARRWTVPASRMKAGREHRVPLSDQVVALLKGLHREEGNPHLFVGAKKGASLSWAGMPKTLKRMGRTDITVHGFRSTFRDWAAEKTHHENHVIEMALAHAVGSAVEKAYKRGDLYAKRAALMEDWARYCAGETTGKVVPLRRAK
ncbi:hypothetical protein AMST5_02168 [freshwater sediment metagenome]|uniref:Integrase n=1 Tax=freshwater sediment metagenome TaxID=556182 RepID=A0AA48LZH4_9ZZZZ